MGQFNQRALRVAEDQQIRLRVRQYRASHLVGPVIVMRDAAQTRFDTADDYGRIGICFATTLRIDDHRPIRSLIRSRIRRVCIIGPQAPISGIAVNHRIHVAGGNAEIQIRLAETLKVGR